MSISKRAFPFVYINLHIVGILRKLFPVITTSMFHSATGNTTNKTAIVTTTLNTVIT